MESEGIATGRGAALIPPLRAVDKELEEGKGEEGEGPESEPESDEALFVLSLPTAEAAAGPNFPPRLIPHGVSADLFLSGQEEGVGLFPLVFFIVSVCDSSLRIRQKTTQIRMRGSPAYAEKNFRESRKESISETSW